MKKIELVKTVYGSFIPAHDSDKELASRVKAGESITASLSLHRSIGFHKKFFALVRYCFHHMTEQRAEQFPTEDVLRRELTLQAGYYETHYTMGGKQIIYPQSISFENMDQEEFEKLYSSVLDCIVKWFVPEIDQDELLNFM